MTKTYHEMVEYARWAYKQEPMARMPKNEAYPASVWAMADMIAFLFEDENGKDIWDVCEDIMEGYVEHDGFWFTEED